MADILISYIIPAYNAGKTIGKAIKSIMDANTEDVEVIVVENGSTDDTSEVVELYSKEHENVILLHSEKGVSNARNKGLQTARGKWIAFVDADDYLVESGLKDMLQDAKKESSDLIVYGHEAGEKINPVTSTQKEVFSKESYDEGRCLMIANPTKFMQVWAKLFKREVVLNNDLKFDSELRLSEDSDFTLRYLKHGNGISLKSEIVYHYSLNENSTMRKKDGEKTKDYIYAMKKTANAVKGENSNIKKAFDKYILMHLNILMVREIFLNSDKFKNKVKSMKQICQHNVFSGAIKRVKVKECRSLRMMPFLFMKIGFNNLAGLIYVVRVKQNTSREVKTNE